MASNGLFWKLSIPSLYLANSGIPLFTQSIVYQVLLFIPIVAIEAYTHRRLLPLSILRAFWLSLTTNLISTLAGVLLLIIAAPLLGMLIFQSPVPVQPGDFPFLPIEILLTLIPMFYLSFLLESLSGRFSLKAIEKPKIKHSFWVANAFTYSMLAILALTQLLKGYLEQRR